MPLSLALILSAVQGITEFLPVSSSGHLALFQFYLSPFFGDYEVPLMFDVFVHFATLTVTLIYVRKEVLQLLSSIFKRGEQFERAHRLIGLIIIGIAPAGIIGLLLRDFIAESFHSMRITGIGFLFTALFLEIAHRAQHGREEISGGGILDENWQLPTWKQALVVGLAQAFSILPGVSRSGSTIAFGLITGLTPVSAIRFSFLISLPVIFGATLLECRKITSLPSSELVAYLIAFVVTAMFGFFALKILVSTVQKTRLRIFAIYTLILGVLVNIIIS